jgi:hypothetical protein
MVPAMFHLEADPIRRAVGYMLRKILMVAKHQDRHVFQIIASHAPDNYDIFPASDA